MHIHIDRGKWRSSIQSFIVLQPIGHDTLSVGSPLILIIMHKFTNSLLTKAFNLSIFLCVLKIC